MKKYILLLAAFGMYCSAFAQQEILVGDMNRDGKISIEDVSVLTDDLLNNRESSFFFDSNKFIYKDGEEHEWVDLGLPSGTLWATCNVGAGSPEEYGDYFAWGEVRPKADNDYSWSSYSLCKSSSYTLTKYCSLSNYGFCGFTDALTELESADDAATFNWGSEWQMPSKAQIEELLNSNNTNTEWTTVNGVKGRKITSRKYPSKSIFLPAGGYRNSDGLKSAGFYGSYWSCSLNTTNTSNPSNAFILNFTSSSIGRSSNYRYCGRSVRPVRVEKRSASITSITLSNSYEEFKVTETLPLTAIIEPADAKNYGVTWSSSDESVATVSAEGLVTAVGKGYASISAIANDGSEVIAICIVNIRDLYVDLGLPSGTLWATNNVGANYPEEFGDYFAWGETVPYYTEGHSQDLICKKWREGKSAGYFWNSYFDAIPTKDPYYPNFKKYHLNGGERVLLPEDDAATVNWGDDWQMPSKAQINELLDSKYTTITWSEVNGVRGKLVVSKVNGNSIFLPSAGERLGTDYSISDKSGNYWSRSIGGDNNYAHHLVFYTSVVDSSEHLGREEHFRCWGYSVRPVRK